MIAIDLYMALTPGLQRQIDYIREARLFETWPTGVIFHDEPTPYFTYDVPDGWDEDDLADAAREFSHGVERIELLVRILSEATRRRAQAALDVG